jgi:hypothetical protein
MSENLFTLHIHHNIFLTKEERYAVHEGREIEVIAGSSPVWVLGLSTSEPAKEIFCKYKIKNSKKDTPVEITKEGYEIDIPCHMEGNPCTSENLLDVIDGGSKAMFYREHNKIKTEDGQGLFIVHYVHLQDIEFLERSITHSL